MFLEIFVVTTSLLLGCFLLVLTTVTQLQIHAASGGGRPILTAFPGALASCFSKKRSRAAGVVRAANDPARDGRCPGKKARRTERRRQIKRALVNKQQHPIL